MEEFVQCPSCDVRFYVVWCNDGISKPEICPFCGEGMNYEESLQ
jgi:hypothetical protein